MKNFLMAAVVLCTACGVEGLESGGVDDLKAATSTSKKGATSSPTYALLTTDAHVSGTAPTWSSSFSTSTAQVLFATDISGTLSGHHTQSVFVFAPGGSAYARYDVAFATDVAASGSEQQAEKTSTGWRVWVSMPVAGTMISQYSLTGAWSAQTWVDSASAPTATAAFTVQ